MNSVYSKAIENLSFLPRTSCDIGKVRLCYCFVHYTVNVLAYFEEPVIKLWCWTYLKIYFPYMPLSLTELFAYNLWNIYWIKMYFYFNLKFQLSVRFFWTANATKQIIVLKENKSLNHSSVTVYKHCSSGPVKWKE